MGLIASIRSQPSSNFSKFEGHHDLEGFCTKSPTSDLRLCRLPCGKPLAFRERNQILNRGYLPRRRTRQIASIEANVQLCGKAQPFRTEGGKAANRKSDFLCKADLNTARDGS